MKNPQTTAIYAGLVVIFFFAMATVHQSCTKKKKGEPTTEEKAEALAEEFTPDTFFEDEEKNKESENGEEGIDYQKTDNQSANVSQTASQPNPSETQNSANPYLVIAGNYLIKSNAEAMVVNLKNKGYNMAEVSVFDLSQYYTVIAGRYDSRTRANSISKNLKNSGIDNYVLRKN